MKKISMKDAVELIGKDKIEEVKNKGSWTIGCPADIRDTEECHRCSECMYRNFRLWRSQSGKLYFEKAYFGDEDAIMYEIIED